MKKRALTVVNAIGLCAGLFAKDLKMSRSLFSLLKIPLPSRILLMSMDHGKDKYEKIDTGKHLKDRDQKKYEKDLMPQILMRIDL